jgi:type IV pilus assembly protein PilX
MKPIHRGPGGRQRGAILIVTLLFLVILTMLGVTAMSGTTMEERMAGNARDASIALQAAEAALRDARRDINAIPVTGTGLRGKPLHVSQFGDAIGTAGTCNTGNGLGLCLPANNPDTTPYKKAPGSVLPNVPKHDMKTDDGPSVKYGAMTNASKIGGADIVSQPRYVIEVFCLQQHGESLDRYCNFYRITAVGYGRTPNTTVTLQETFITL